MPTLNASNLILDDVHRLLHLEEQSNGSFTTLLSLSPLTEIEQQDLLQIRNDFRRYLSGGKISEGLVKFIAFAPLMRLAGFYRYPIEIMLEESIADIDIEDEDTKITGRMDILAVNKATSTTTGIPFWILVIESKNSGAEVFQGLPQLLTYAFKNLDQQPSMWGLVTNGLRYQFVYLRQGTLPLSPEAPSHPTYQLLPELNLIESERTIELLQVLKAICNLQNSASPV
jgi:hypothetical protein